MNTNEAAEKWKYSVKMLRSFCDYEYIPLAEKEGFRWKIPNKAVRPPLTVERALNLLAMIDQIKEKASPDFSIFGISLRTIRNAYDYLADIAWCSKVKWVIEGGVIDFNASLEKVTITPLGREKIRKKELTRQKKKKYGGKVTVPIGPAAVEVFQETEVASM